LKRLELSPECRVTGKERHVLTPRWSVDWDSNEANSE
jgi:hypothetical protein